MATFLSLFQESLNREPEKLEKRDAWYIFESSEYGRIVVKSCETCHGLAVYGKKGCEAKRCKVHRIISDTLTVVKAPLLNRNKGCFKYQGETSRRKSVAFSDETTS